LSFIIQTLKLLTAYDHKRLLKLGTAYFIFIKLRLRLFLCPVFFLMKDAVKLLLVTAAVAHFHANKTQMLSCREHMDLAYRDELIKLAFNQS
jgi:hypothetical protein